MVYDAEGKPFYLEGVVEDVTERQKTHDALRSVKEELELENTMRTINLVVANERLKREIEERKKAEAELMESEERFRAIFESAEDAILVKNLRRVYTHVNPAMGRLLGMPISELIGRRVEDFLSLLDEAASLWDQDTHVLRGEVVKAETPLSLGERQVVLNIIKAPLRDDAGNIIGICGIARDITECKLGEERMRQSERRLRSLVENSLVGIMIVTNRRVVFCNQEMEKLLGTSPKNLDSGERGFQTKNLAKLLRLYRSVVGGKSKVLDEELELLRSEGTDQGASTKWVHCRASLIECKGRESVLFNIMDVTKLKEFEQLLRIEDKMTSLGHVAAGIAHEIRNPLTGINTYLHSLRRLLGAGVGDEEAVRMAQNIIEEIRSASGRINTVIRRVMDFSKPSLPQFALLDMNDCIDDVLALSAATLRKRSIQVDKRLRRGLPKCHADRQMMEQVLMNIVTNAAHAMKSSKGPRTLRINSDGEDGAILVSISDSGPGVPEELRKKIFDPFFTTKSNGAGIGLSISQRIMADHLGSLLVGESSLGGAKFTLRMPAYAHVERDDE
jgi:PAS domain S-box-containing protein